ncbi:MAG: hypothetical protein AB8G05_19185 [Oligoflexales bacterium]
MKFLARLVRLMPLLAINISSSLLGQVENQDYYPFTVFLRGAQGTAENSTDQTFFDMSIITKLSKSHPGNLYMDYIDINGLLSGDRQKGDRFYDNSMDPGILKRLIKHKGIKFDVKHILNVLRLDNQNPNHSKHKYLENIIKKYFPNNKNHKKWKRSHSLLKVTHLNVMCYSMGCLTAFKLAHKLLESEDLNNIKLSMLMIDPVGGLIYSNNKSYLTLPENVETVHAIYATNERSVFFEPIVPTCLNENAEVVFYNFPGNHLNIVGNRSTTHPWTGESKKSDIKAYELEKMLQPISLIVRDLAEKFLIDRGVALMDTLNLNTKQILRYYALIEKYQDYYKKCELDSFTLIKNRGRARRARVFGENQWSLPYLDEVIGHDFLEDDGYI